MAKFYCDVVGLEHNFIDFVDKWTRGEVKKVEAAEWADDAEFFDFIGQKSNSLHIVDEAGNVAASVDELTDEFLDNCDARLAGFISAAPLTAARGLTRLGNFSVRKSSDTAATMKA